jgi:hypothetical protein
MSALAADVTLPGGLGDQALAAARAMSDDDKVKVGDVLSVRVSSYYRRESCRFAARKCCAE